MGDIANLSTQTAVCPTLITFKLTPCRVGRARQVHKTTGMTGRGRGRGHGRRSTSTRSMRSNAGSTTPPGSTFAPLDLQESEMKPTMPAPATAVCCAGSSNVPDHPYEPPASNASVNAQHGNARPIPPWVLPPPERALQSPIATVQAPNEPS